ncbi:hypothetical protein CAPTEDRAFT_180519 [Capitella teleta]|uniref:Protein AAR2 homolog n=1 Tax=Capitella teleta TaxID=283909 RepID=R7VE27_CAPTE|nr:hypothetical protein CAPTEDRAFT_180519 [Capitella teleta]|eukprot:ELU14556.1 hypothetical protein CAPTEDRAFT_180519 [Capitella teleta]
MEQECMSQETAQWLFEEGAMLVFLDVPEGTEFGMDCNSWEVGPKFKGVKMIPPGVHFIYYSARDKRSTQLAPRTGFFHTFSRKEVLVKRWDEAAEDINSSPVSSDEQERIESNRKELDRFMGAYPYESYKKWVSLTNHMSSDLIHKLSPVSGRICSAPPLESNPSDTASRMKSPPPPVSKTRPTERDLMDMKSIPGSEIRFSEITSHKFPVGSTPGEITRHLLDCSYSLRSLLDANYPSDASLVLGEIQFAFVCFLVGQVYDAFDQWKKLTKLMCSCESAISQYPDLYLQFITLLHYHIREIPEDFFVDIVTSDNFVVAVLRSLFANMFDSQADGNLKGRGLKFKEHLEKKYKWDLNADTDEDAPVIVQ